MDIFTVIVAAVLIVVAWGCLVFHMMRLDVKKAESEQQPAKWPQQGE